MSAHTPGPWELTCERDREHAFNNVGSKGVDWPRSEIALVPCDNPDYRWNQALIVAAPKMLAALRGALEHLGPGDYIASIGLPKTEAMRAAIAAAEGLP